MFFSETGSELCMEVLYEGQRPVVSDCFVLPWTLYNRVMPEFIYIHICVCVCACEWVRKRWYALAWTHVWFVLVEVLKRIQACKLQYFSATSCVLDYVDKKGGTLNYYSFGKCLCSVLFLVILDEDVTFWAVVLVVLFVCLFLLYWGTSSPSMATEESNR